MKTTWKNTILNSYSISTFTYQQVSIIGQRLLLNLLMNKEDKYFNTKSISKNNMKNIQNNFWKAAVFSTDSVSVIM